MNLTRQPTRIARSWWIFALLATLAMAAGLFAAQETFKRAAVAALGDDTEGDAELKRSLLLAVLDRSRALPLVLAGDAELAAALANPDVPAISRLNSKLETLAARTQASVIYVIARDGTAIAASNWRQADSFVGSNYGFRDYFTSAMEAGTAEQYALGTVSRRPGLYIAHRVTAADGQALGVVVVKVEFDALEESWRRSNRITFVTDSRGVVLITSRPDWRFFTTSDIPPHELGALRDSLQFGEAPLTPIPIWSLYDDDGHAWVASEGTGSMPSEQFLRVDMEVGGAPWTLHVLAPANTAVEAGMWQGRLLAFALIMPLIGIAAFLLYRSGRSARQRALEQAAREELERQVTLRTVELTEARDRLEAEIAEHHATDIRLQGVQQDLVQANRLAILGQVAAGVAHEINQPVATIRAYADNAKAFLDRGNGETAKENLGLIAELTERIGAITGELKSLARKGRQAAEPVELKAAIDGALFLLKSRFAGSFDRLKIGDIPADIKVLGQRIRLEQVLINLLQNALEAIEGKADAAINIGLSRLTDDELDLAVSDTGPGLPEHVRDNLFIPFTTSKEGGLGLGLVIARDIVTEYGGRISVESSAAGTTFTITLKRANI